MSGSTIRLSQQGEEGVSLVARVFGAGGSEEQLGSMSEVIVPPHGDVSVAVDPGLYSIQLLLPSGAIIQRRCEVVEDVPGIVVFDARGRASVGLSGNERFSLQGAVSEAPAADLVKSAARFTPTQDAPQPVSRVRRAPTQTSLATRIQTPRKSFGASSRSGIRSASGSTALISSHSGVWQRSATPTAPTQPIVRLATAADFSGDASWARLAKSPSNWRRAITPTDRLAAATPPLNGVGLWTMPGETAARGRAWALIENRNGFEIASLPLPWPTADGSTSVELMVDERVRGKAMTSVALRDSGIGGLLAYLDNGRLSLVGPFLELLEKNGAIDRAIYGDATNPLAACVAAYARLATAPRERSERWDRWLADLMTLNPGIPDCAIVHARSVALRPDDTDEAGEAKMSLARAFEAGVPYFSVGLQIMRDMLVAGSRRDAGQRELLSKVLPVVRRCDPTGMITVLRYPEAYT